MQKEKSIMIDQLLRKLKEEYPETAITNNIKACYYILPNGKMLTIGFQYGMRTEDHRAIFVADDELKYNDWTSLHQKYSLVGYCPETQDAWIAKNQQLTEAQEKTIKKYKINLLVENF